MTEEDHLIWFDEDSTVVYALCDCDLGFDHSEDGYGYPDEALAGDQS